MAKKNVHVVPCGSGWAVKTEGTQKPLSNHRTQQAASDAGRKVAQQNQSELVIHRPNGQIRDKDSYGNDQFPSRDQKNASSAEGRRKNQDMHCIMRLTDER